MSVSDDRWSCPRCPATVIADPRMGRDVAAAYVRLGRDHHGRKDCPAVTRR